MRGLETIATPIFFFFGCSQKVTLALLGDRNVGLKIGCKGWVGQASVGSGSGHHHPPPCPGQETPSTQAPPAALHFSSCARVCVCLSVFLLIPF
jgi:hypothetical protein